MNNRHPIFTTPGVGEVKRMSLNDSDSDGDGDGVDVDGGGCQSEVDG